MNREQANKLLPVIQAFAEGKKIQYRCSPRIGEWTDIEEPTWIRDYEYRLKPTLESDLYDYLFGVYKEDSTRTATTKIMQLIKDHGYEQVS